MSYIRITEYASTVNYQRFVDNYASALAINAIEEKCNCTVGMSGGNGCFLGAKYLGQYNKYEFGNIASDTIEVIDIDGNTLAWTTLAQLIARINQILQIETTIEGGITVNSKDVECIELCDLHGCTDPLGVVQWDGGGAANTLGISGTWDGVSGTIQRVDWGDGTILDYDDENAVSHSYSAALLPFTATVRVILKSAGGFYFAVIGHITLTGIGGSSTGTWEDQLYTPQPYIKFLRNIVYNSAGAVDSVFDTELDGVTPYTASPFVKDDCCDCEDDDFYVLMIVDENYTLLTASGTLNLDYGVYNYISIVFLSGTGTLNGSTVGVGFAINYQDDKQRYRGALEITTDPASTAMIQAAYLKRI